MRVFTNAPLTTHRIIPTTLSSSGPWNNNGGHLPVLICKRYVNCFEILWKLSRFCSRYSFVGGAVGALVVVGWTCWCVDGVVQRFCSFLPFYFPFRIAPRTNPLFLHSTALDIVAQWWSRTFFARFFFLPLPIPTIFHIIVGIIKSHRTMSRSKYFIFSLGAVPPVLVD